MVSLFCASSGVGLGRRLATDFSIIVLHDFFEFGERSRILWPLRRRMCWPVRLPMSVADQADAEQFRRNRSSDEPPSAFETNRECQVTGGSRRRP